MGLIVMHRVLGLILTDASLFPQLRAMIERLAELRISVKVAVCGPETVSGVAVSMRLDGVTGLLVAEGGSGTVSIALAAESRTLPDVAFCLGPRSAEREAALIQAAAGSALLITPANHPLHAAQAVARILGSGDFSPSSAMNLQARQLSQQDAEASRSLQKEADAILQGNVSPARKPRKGPLIDPKASARHSANPDQTISPEDEETLGRVAEEMKPRYSEKRTPIATPEQPKPREFSTALRTVMTTARELARKHQYDTLDARHLFAALLECENGKA